MGFLVASIGYAAAAFLLGYGEAYRREAEARLNRAYLRQIYTPFSLGIADIYFIAVTHKTLARTTAIATTLTTVSTILVILLLYAVF